VQRESNGSATEAQRTANSGATNQEPITKNHKPRTKKDNGAPPGGDAVLFPGVEEQVIADFKALRLKAKAPITPTAMQEIAKQAELAGLSLEGALRVCCARGWRGFKAEWVQDDRRKGGGNGSANGAKFQVAGVDHASTRTAAAATQQRHNIAVPDGEIEF
jgi:hypothetical protein